MQTGAVATHSHISLTSCLQVIAAILWIGIPAFSQTVINVPPDPSPTSVSSNTTVNLLEGGMITLSAYEAFNVGNFDGTSTNAILNIEGGQFMSKAFASKLRVNPGGVLIIHGGEIVGQIDALGGNINIDGGLIGTGGVHIGNGSTVSIGDGTLNTTISSESNGVLLISGGSVGNVQSRANGTARISGGAIGAVGNGENGSSILLLGGDYRVNGVPIPNLIDVGNSQQFDIPDGASLTGVLQDGSPFAFIDSIDAYIDSGVLTLETVPLPPIGPSVIRASTGVIPYGIRSGQTLVVDNGGVVPNRFTAITGSTVNIEPGGILGHDFEAFEAVVNMSGGSAGGGIGDGFTLVKSQLNMSGGFIWAPSAVCGSKVAVSGGEIGSSLDLASGSEAIVTGGSFAGLRIGENSIAEIKGGDFSTGAVVVLSGGAANIFGGSFSTLGQFQRGLDVEAGGAVHLFGSQFKINGVDVQGLLSGQSFTITQRNVTLTGILRDGSPFSFPLNAVRPRGGALVSQNATLTVTLVPEPPSTVVVLFSIFLFALTATRNRREKGTQLFS